MDVLTYLVTQLWPNIAADVLAGLVGYFWGRRHVRRLHSKLDLIHEHIKQQERK